MNGEEVPAVVRACSRAWITAQLELLETFKQNRDELVAKPSLKPGDHVFIPATIRCINLGPANFGSWPVKTIVVSRAALRQAMGESDIFACPDFVDGATQTAGDTKGMLHGVGQNKLGFVAQGLVETKVNSEMPMYTTAASGPPLLGARQVVQEFGLMDVLAGLTECVLQVGSQFEHAAGMAGLPIGAGDERVLQGDSQFTYAEGMVDLPNVDTVDEIAEDWS
uniref:Uncharacterized protein n=1 Tax=Aureoumbra lagunensis TaxID=44058 RepID=A0A7S3JVI9_9STRA|mmetsp:Transcript_12040/g.16290  ORF Transcript_12040/g.16290 Transcript_12040/m.16290 type:complete len:223 (+) Transcript_12040:1001-1669(+)